MSHWFILPIILLAVETGLRRGEILSLRWEHIDREAASLLIPHAKNGHSRIIPLTNAAAEIIGTPPALDDRVFPVSRNAFRLAWERLRARAGMVDLHFHDLRHEAISRFFEKGLIKIRKMKVHNNIKYYVDNNFSLVPLAYRSKQAACSWSEFQQRHASLRECELWFGKGTETNVGIITGAISEIIVLDVDGEEGELSLLSLGSLPATPSVRTGKGRHLYFKHPGFPVRNFIRIKPGLDVRGDGGYVVAPPSVHPDGSVYEWLLHPADQPFAELPKWLSELLIGPKGREELSAPKLSKEPEPFPYPQGTSKGD
jgi:Bifunctional DNA primase/polymerase, N-terminal/Phage integrase family